MSLFHAMTMVKMLSFWHSAKHIQNKIAVPRVSFTVLLQCTFRVIFSMFTLEKNQNNSPSFFSTALIRHHDESNF